MMHPIPPPQPLAPPIGGVHAVRVNVDRRIGLLFLVTSASPLLSAYNSRMALSAQCRYWLVFFGRRGLLCHGQAIRDTLRNLHFGSNS